MGFLDPKPPTRAELNATYETKGAVATEIVAKTPSAMFDTAKDSNSLFALRAAAQLAASSSPLVLIREFTNLNTFTSGNVSTWIQVANASFSFVAPTSGRVVIKFQVGWEKSSGEAELRMRLVNQSNVPYSGTERRLAYTQSTSGLPERGQVSYTAHLSGLTPGATVTCQPSIANTATTAQPSVKSDTGTVYGPAMLEVHALPIPPISDTAVITKTGPNALPAWVAAKAAVAAGTGSRKVLLIGDSTQNGDAADNPAKRLVTKLQARSIAAVMGGTAPGRTAAINTLYTGGAGWPGSFSTLNYGFGSSAWTYNNPAGALTYADPSINANSFDVYYLVQPSGGTLTLQVGSETPVVLNTVGSASIAKATVTVAAGLATSHVLSMTATGNGAVMFVEPFDSTTSKIRVAKGAVNTTDTGTWNNGTGIYSKSMIAAYQPDVIIALLGANDTIVARPTSTFISNLIGIAAAYPAANFIVASPIPSQTAGEYSLMRDYAIRERYATSFPFIDLGQHFGTWEQANAAGWMADVRHPNAAGMEQMAILYDQMLATA